VQGTVRRRIRENLKPEETTAEYTEEACPPHLAVGLFGRLQLTAAALACALGCVDIAP
jgi:hypothetical protein